MPLPITIGGVTLQTWEIPAEFGPIGGEQIIAEHKFPGGTITQQELGAFPEPLSWKGYLTGASAFGREQALDAIRAAGQDVSLTWGPYSWTGKVTKFGAQARHAFLIDYQITFSPSQGPSGQGVAGGPFDDSILNNINFGAQTAAISSMVAGDPFPDDLLSSADGLLTAIAIGLQNGDGTIAGLFPDDAVAVQTAAAAAQSASLPLIAGDDAGLASHAIDFWALAGNVAAATPVITANVVTGAILAQFTAVNPNLFSIAQQYYGDSSLWTAIAKASGMSDPQPTGTFKITVPSQPGAT